MSLRITGAVLVTGLALAVPMVTVPSVAQAGTEPPPCTKKAIKAAIKKKIDAPISIDTKLCKNYWAAGAFTVAGEDSGAYLLEDYAGAWKMVGTKKRAKLCRPSNTTLPGKIKKRACVS